ncbi:MAG: hypothetical protein ACK4NX_01220, partial [Candidatus Paceibacteria bacterium]
KYRVHKENFGKSRIRTYRGLIHVYRNLLKKEKDKKIIKIIYYSLLKTRLKLILFSILPL